MALRSGRSVIVKMIHARDAFKQASVSGRIYANGLFVESGRLSTEHRLALRGATGPTYVVFSYATPIAWWTAADGWTVPDASYSPTTTNHVSVVRMAIDSDVS